MLRSGNPDAERGRAQAPPACEPAFAPPVVAGRWEHHHLPGERGRNASANHHLRDPASEARDRAVDRRGPRAGDGRHDAVLPRDHRRYDGVPPRGLRVGSRDALRPSGVRAAEGHVHGHRSRRARGRRAAHACRPCCGRISLRATRGLEARCIEARRRGRRRRSRRARGPHRRGERRARCPGRAVPARRAAVEGQHHRPGRPRGVPATARPHRGRRASGRAARRLHQRHRVRGRLRRGDRGHAGALAGAALRIDPAPQPALLPRAARRDRAGPGDRASGRGRERARSARRAGVRLPARHQHASAHHRRTGRHRRRLLPVPAVPAPRAAARR